LRVMAAKIRLQQERQARFLNPFKTS